MNIENLIVHIPHASLKINRTFIDRLKLDENSFNEENVFCADLSVDRLLPADLQNIVRFPMSRLLCDAERFLDDEEESMSMYGMGAVYIKDSKGRTLIEVDEAYKTAVINEYYLPHHNRMDEMTAGILDRYGTCYILDWHSFSDEYVELLFGKKNCPDICIGFEEAFLDKGLLGATEDFFREKGYSVQLNYPFSGSFVPNKYFRACDKIVKSLMLEFNKRIYLHENKAVDSDKFNRLRCAINEYIAMLCQMLC